MYQVYDRQTGQNVGKPVQTLSAATKKVNKLDSQYGAVRYGYRRQ
jgi:hypothetical protein